MVINILPKTLSLKSVSSAVITNMIGGGELNTSTLYCSFSDKITTETLRSLLREAAIINVPTEISSRVDTNSHFSVSRHFINTHLFFLYIKSFTNKYLLERKNVERFKNVIHWCSQIINAESCFHL